MKNWQKNTKDIVIAVEDCDLDDSTYIIPCFADLETLKRSIMAVGMIHRPLVQRNEKRKWIPIIGRRRMVAAKELGFGAIGASILEDGMDEALCYELAFWDNISHREFDTPTKAVVVYRLLQLYSREEVAKRFLPALGIPAYGPRLEALCRIATLDSDIHHLMAVGRLSEKTALMLTHLPLKERQVIMDLVKRLKPNINKSAEIIGSLLDLATYRGSTVEEILNAPEIRELLVLSGSSHPTDLTDKLRQLLRKIRYPELNSQEAKFSEWLKTQRLPPNINVRPAQAFEDKSCTIEVRVESKEKATDLLGQIIAMEYGD